MKFEDNHNFVTASSQLKDLRKNLITYSMIDCGFGINHEYKNISIKAMIIDPFVQIWANIYTRTKMDLVGLHSQQYKKTCSLFGNNSNQLIHFSSMMHYI